MRNIYGGAGANTGGGFENAILYGNQSSVGPSATTGSIKQRTSNTAEPGRRPGRSGGANYAARGPNPVKAGGFASGLDGMEPNSNMAHHMQLVNSIINDGSLHNLVFSNGSLNTELL